MCTFTEDKRTNFNYIFERKQFITFVCAISISSQFVLGTEQ